MQINPSTVCFIFISLNFYLIGEEIAFPFRSQSKPFTGFRLLASP